MAHNARLPTRTRGAQRTRVTGDENATSKHIRTGSGVGLAGSRLSGGIGKTGAQRPALGEVTTIAVNRKRLTQSIAWKDIAGKVGGKEKDNAEAGLKRKSVGPQRVTLTTAAARARTSIARAPRASLLPAKRNTTASQAASTLVIAVDEEYGEKENSMDIEEPERFDEPEPEASLLVAEQEVQDMVEYVSEPEDEVEAPTQIPAEPKPERIWPEVSTDRRARYRHEVDAIKEVFEDSVDMFDTTMVSEYSEDIFQYMEELEESVMPSPDYMSSQNEITWAMRQTLVDWLLQVHLRYHMLPETLWIAINIVDRFLTKRIVSLVKLQLVGVTAMFIAAKYEEILAPSVDEFVFMTENGYTKEEILKGERIMLQTLEFKVSHYCSPYSWMRKISKADDYDIQTRTLSKFLTEVTLLDHRFLRVKPSLVAAVGMYTARRMLGGDWSEAFVFHSGYTEEQLIPGHNLLADKLTEEGFSRQYVCKKYANKKFLKASLFAIEWARVNGGDCEAEGMMLEQ
ncbi:hypothetical protein HWV62_2370 [Athelia sp. TMB]|nr:hypothetical protein HWV62_2370 [Athelia sp. TMB]